MRGGKPGFQPIFIELAQDMLVGLGCRLSDANVVARYEVFGRHLDASLPEIVGHPCCVAGREGPDGETSIAEFGKAFRKAFPWLEAAVRCEQKFQVLVAHQFARLRDAGLPQRPVEDRPHHIEHLPVAAREAEIGILPFCSFQPGIAEYPRADTLRPKFGPEPCL